MTRDFEPQTLFDPPPIGPTEGALERDINQESFNTNMVRTELIAPLPCTMVEEHLIEGKLHSLETAHPIEVPLDKRGRVRWSRLAEDAEKLKAYIEQEANAFRTEYGMFNSPILYEVGRSSLSAAITNYYPGGMKALQDLMGITGRRPPDYSKYVIEDENGLPRNKNGNIRWATLKGDTERIKSAIKAEVARYYEEGITLTTTLLAQHHRRDLLNAIGAYYPGGFTQLRADLGYEALRKPDNYWQDPGNIKREAQIFLDDHGELSVDELRRFQMGGLESAIGTSYPGGWAGIRSDLGLEPFREPKGYWTPETIEEEAKRFYSEHGVLNTNVLKVAGRNDLLIAVARKYPGRWPSLYEKLGLSPTKKEYGYWTKEQIEQESREFLDHHGKLSSSELSKNGRNDLLHAIADKYPGKMRGLKQHLGLSVRKTQSHVNGRRQMRYWQDPKNIEREAAELLAVAGVLGDDIASQNGKTGLLDHARRYYPGGIKALRAKLDSEIVRRPYGYWLNPENIEREAREVLEIEGRFSHKLLAKHGKSSLVAHIKFYPGGFEGLRAALGLKSNSRVRGYWTIERIEQEAREFYLQEGHISVYYLESKGFGALASALNRYPGGIRALRAKLSEQAPLSSQTANKQLERLLET